MKPRPFLIGLVLALGSITLLASLPKPTACQLLAVFVAALGGIYTGLGLSVTDNGKFALQAFVSIFFLVLSLMGLWIHPRFLGVGLLAHAGWDTMHHPTYLNIFVPGWYVPTCLAYDVVLGIFVLLWW